MGKGILVAVSEDKSYLQDEERRNRTRSKVFEEELASKQQALGRLETQQNERRAHLRALDEEIIKKQQAINRLSLDMDTRSLQFKPLDEQMANKQQALNKLTAQCEEKRLQLRALGEEVGIKQHTIASLGDQSSDAIDKERAISDLLLQHRKLQEQVEVHRRKYDEKMLESASVEARSEVIASTLEKKQLRLRLVEQEAQAKTQSLETLSEMAETAEQKYRDLQYKAMQLEAELIKKGAQSQALDEEIALKKQHMQLVTVKHEAVTQQDRSLMDPTSAKHALTLYRGGDNLQQENAELKEEISVLKQELFHVQMAFDDKSYQGHTLEVSLAMQKQSKGQGELRGGSALSSAGETLRQQMLQMLRRQEDRITAQQYLLVELEAKLARTDKQLADEQELKPMLENELQVALAELHLEKGKLAALQRICDVQELKINTVEAELDRLRHGNLVRLRNQEAASSLADSESQPAFDVTESLRRQQCLLEMIEETLPQKDSAEGTSLQLPVEAKA